MKERDDKHTLRLSAPAKLNLTLDVLRRREDGYHEMDMLMISVSITDTLYMSPAAESGVSCVGMQLPENNTISRAIAVYSEYAGRQCGARVKLHKHIPAEAGMGGGSADAAATLRGMQRLYHALSSEALQDAALRVGADVPFCLHNDPCRAGGVGEKLIFLRIPRTALWFLVLKPHGGISTGALFSTLQLPLTHPETDKAQRALIRGDIRALGAAVQNAMQPAAAALLPEIGFYCERLLACGALGAAMTGAGSAVFGLFLSEQAAREAGKAFSDIAYCEVCHSIVHTG